MKCKTVSKDNIIHVCRDEDVTVCGIHYDGMRVTPITSSSELVRYTNGNANGDNLCSSCLVWEFITEWK